MTLPLSAQTRLLVVAPHPDDETLATGVLIQQVRDAGGSVHVLLLTDGDNNPWPQRWLERRWRIRPADRARWAQLRRDELRASMAVLGLAPSALTALGWPDQGLTARLQCAARESVATVQAVLGGFAPDLVAMPALDDRHPDHSAAHVLMRLAMADAGQPWAMLLYRVHGAPGAADADLVLPADGIYQRRKREALNHHRSQLALSGKRMARLAARAERYQFRPAPARSVLPWHPPRAAWPWLALTVVTRDGGAVWTWRHAARSFTGPGGDVLAPVSATDVAPGFAKLQLALPSLWIFDHWGWCELPH